MHKFFLDKEDQNIVTYAQKRFQEWILQEKKQMLFITFARFVTQVLTMVKHVTVARLECYMKP